MERRSLDLKLEVLGSRHPETAHVMAQLWARGREQGLYNEEESFAAQVLDYTIAVLRPRNPDTVVAKFNVAQAWWIQGRAQ